MLKISFILLKEFTATFVLDLTRQQAIIWTNDGKFTDGYISVTQPNCVNRN